jgi:broad specificity phosphatase PhoE
LDRPARRAIALARHGEPALSRRVKLTSSGYRDWWATYEEGGIRTDQGPPDSLRALAARSVAIFSSTRRRAIETARAVVGDRPFTSDPVFIEAPLPPPPFPDSFRVSPRTWGVIARAAWWLGYGEGGETRAEAEARAAEAADLLVKASAEGGEVLLLAHGYFNNMIGIALQRRGWKLTQDQGFRYWSVRRFEPRG